MTARMSDAIDDDRKTQIAKDYLLRLAEMREWLVNVVTSEEFPDVSDLEDFLADGVVIATLASLILPDKFNRKIIFDKSHTSYYEQKPLNFRHTDNINIFFKFATELNFPRVFLFETTDLYERKNLPKVIYCLYALSMFLYKKGFTPRLQNLTGKMQFSEEQIKKVMTALDSYGIQLPKFHTIGGILATELSVDDAALHAAILLINQELDKDSHENFLVKLQDPSALLEHISPERVEKYFLNLKKMKETKVEETNKLGKADEDLDIYDKMLTQMEIQSELSAVNLTFLLEELTDAVKSGNVESMCQCLAHTECGLHGVNIQFKNYYFEALKSKLAEKPAGSIFTHDEVRMVIKSSNATASKDTEIDNLILKIQSHLKNSTVDPDEIMNKLQSSQSLLPPIIKQSAVLYCHSLAELFQSNGHKTPNRESFLKTLEMLHTLSTINSEVEKLGRLAPIISLLASPIIQIKNLNGAYEPQYADRIKELQEQKLENFSRSVPSNGLPHRFHLMHNEIQECIDEVNARMSISKLLSDQSAIDPKSLYHLLSSSGAQYMNLDPKNEKSYCEALLNEIKQLRDSGMDSELSHDTIQRNIDNYNRLCAEGRSMIPHIVKLDTILRQGTPENKQNEIFSLLEKCCVTGLISDCKSKYVSSLKEALTMRMIDDSWNGWIKHSLPSTSQTFYYNHKTDEFRWLPPVPEVQANRGYLARPDLQNICMKTTAGHNREMYYEANVPAICMIQAFISAARFTDILKRRDDVMLIRSFVRTHLIINQHRKKLEFMSSNYSHALEIKSFILSSVYTRRCQILRRKIQENVKAIVVLQSLIRTEMCYNDYSSLVQSDTTSVDTLSKYLRFLELDANDLRDERMLFTLGSTIEKLSAIISDLNKDCEVLDSTLTFTTESRLNVQQMARRKQGIFSWLAKKPQTAAVFSGQESIERDRLLNNCGQLCYIIKTYPKYMSELFVVPSLTNSQKEILKLFTHLFGNCARLKDEYGMVSFMDEVLKRLVKSLESCDEFLKSNFPVINVLAEYWRDRSIQGWLKDSMFAMVTEFYHDSSFSNLHFESDKIAQFTLTQIQTEKGNEKLDQEEVVNRVDKNASHHISLLKKYVTQFVDGVIDNFSKVPYPVRVFVAHINKYMKERFPGAQYDREIKKITVYFIFLKLYLPLWTTPKLLGIDVSGCHAFEQKVVSASSIVTFISSAIKDNISEEKISKILKSEEYVEIAKYCSEKLSKFTENVINVVSIEETYASVIGLTDEYELNVPQWPMTIEKLCILYGMLKTLVNKDKPPMANNVLQRVLDSFETTLTWERFFPKSYDITEEAAHSTTILITLVPVPDPEREDKRKMDDMLVSTKKILIDVLNCVPGDNLKEILSTSITSEHEKKYQELHHKRTKLYESVVGQDKSISEDKSNKILLKYPSIQEAINVALTNIKVLISAGIIADTSDLCDLVLMMAKDVKTLRQLRKSRADDVIRMRDVVDSMEKKKKHLETKKASLENVLRDISSQMDNPKSKKVIKKKLDYFITKEIFIFSSNEIKKKVMSSLSSKTATVLTKKNANGSFSLQVQAAGSVVSSYDFSYQDLNRFQAMGQYKIEQDEYAINVNFLINFVNNHFSLV